MLIKSQNGFSLIETLIGLVIFGLIGIAILTSLAASTRSNMTNGNLTKAESLARAQMEYIQSQSYNATNNGTIYPPEYSTISLPSGFNFATPIVNMVIRIDDEDNPVTIDEGLQKIHVSVQHDNHTLFTVTDYKVNR